MILAVARQTINHDEHTRLGEWKRFSSFELCGKKLGLIGFGAIGQGVARRAIGFGMNVVAYDPFFNENAAKELGVKRASFDEVITDADIISLHLPCTNETYHIINSDAFNKMKRSAVIINTARGDLIDENALIDALKNQRINGAGLDVYSHEPIHESPLFELKNVVLMPHCSANTVEAAMKMGLMAVENAHRALNGLEDAHILN